MTHTDQTAAIRDLNDELRTTGTGGRTLVSAGVAALPLATQVQICSAVAHFGAFTAENDPHGEHDCARISVGKYTVIWKIDYYDLDLLHHSDNPADHAVTQRVLTISLTEEY